MKQLCEYGCGKVAKHPPAKGRLKWCCEEFPNKCENIKTRNSDKNKGRLIQKFKKIEVINLQVLCENGCGNVAKYITKQGKKYCSDDHRTCSINKLKYSNDKSNCPKGKHNKLFGRKRPRQSELMKLNNPMFVEKYKQKVKKLTSTNDYKIRMSEISTLMWKDQEKKKKLRLTMEKKKLWIPEQELSKFEKYRREVMKYTRENVKRYLSKHNFIIGVGKGYYSIDHRFSISEGFRQNIDPKLIGSHHNLQIMKFEENSKKHCKCSISFEELKKNENII